MAAVLADTFYFIALLNRNDPMHAEAIEQSRVAGLKFFTTDYVLVELGDAFHKPPLREEFNTLLDLILGDDSFVVIPASSELFQRGREFYRRHRDKEWQLTDCISFAVMKEYRIQEALTGDKHFEQAGFTALLK